jgi:hypothetical protein
MKFWHWAAIVVVVFVCIWASNNISAIGSLTGQS